MEDNCFCNTCGQTWKKSEPSRCRCFWPLVFIDSAITACAAIAEGIMELFVR